ncbi:MAG: ABC transporter permease [Candidatus Latescibacteria bacterium]|nr:ABC transporter permease [Candidatus Latescibacterota bacterium]
MRHRLALGAYLAAVVAATMIHDPLVLAIWLAAVLALAGRDLPHVLKRAVLSVLLFTGIVSVSYLALSLLEDRFSGRTLLLLNLRVLLLSSMTFLFARKADLFEAFGFSRSLRFLLVLVYGQTLLFRRLIRETREAFASRSIGRPGLLARYRRSAATGALLYEKSIRNAAESGQAMRSRGLFVD